MEQSISIVACEVITDVPFMEGWGWGLQLATTLPYITYVTLGNPSRLSELSHTGEMTDLG